MLVAGRRQCSFAQQRVTYAVAPRDPRRWHRVVGSPAKSRATERRAIRLVAIKSRERNRLRAKERGERGWRRERERERERKVRVSKSVCRPFRPRKMAPSCFEVILVGFILVLPFLYETSRTFRYYFKFLIYYGIVMVNAFLLMPVISLRPGNVKNFLLVARRYRSILLCCHISRGPLIFLALRLCSVSLLVRESHHFRRLLARFVFLVHRSINRRYGEDRRDGHGNLLTGARCLFSGWR